MKRRNERGSAAVEAVAGAAAFAAFCGLVAFAGQIAVAHQGVQAAASDAARAASIARTAGTAQRDAEAAARQGLGNHGLVCAATAVAIDVSGFAVPVGQPAWVSATVRCDVSSANLGLPIDLGTVHVEETMRSALDTYRSRI